MTVASIKKLAYSPIISIKVKHMEENILYAQVSFT